MIKTRRIGAIVAMATTTMGVATMTMTAPAEAAVRGPQPVSNWLRAVKADTQSWIKIYWRTDRTVCNADVRLSAGDVDIDYSGRGRSATFSGGDTLRAGRTDYIQIGVEPDRPGTVNLRALITFDDCTRRARPQTKAFTLVLPVSQGSSMPGGDHNPPGKPGDHGPGKPGDDGHGKPGGNDDGHGKPGGNDDGHGKPGGNDDGHGKPGGNDDGHGKPGDNGPGKPGDDSHGKPGDDSHGKPGDNGPGRPGDHNTGPVRPGSDDNGPIRPGGGDTPTKPGPTPGPTKPGDDGKGNGRPDRDDNGGKGHGRPDPTPSTTTPSVAPTVDPTPTATRR